MTDKKDLPRQDRREEMKALINRLTEDDADLSELETYPLDKLMLLRRDVGHCGSWSENRLRLLEEPNKMQNLKDLQNKRPYCGCEEGR